MTEVEVFVGKEVANQSEMYSGLDTHENGGPA